MFDESNFFCSDFEEKKERERAIEDQSLNYKSSYISISTMLPFLQISDKLRGKKSNLMICWLSRCVRFNGDL